MTKAKVRRPNTNYIWIALFVLTIFVYFFGLTIPLLGPDEPRYAQVAREMLARGDWITPTLGGFNWFEKPALLYWLQIVSYKLFGVSEFAARFGSTVFGLGTIFILWLLGRFSAAENTEISEINPGFSEKSVFPAANDFANWLALIAASSIGIIVFSRGASFDIILTFPMTASLVSFFIFDTVSKRSANPGSDSLASSRRLVAAPLIAFYFFIGVSLLAKGLIGIVFPFAIVGFYYLLSLRFPGKIFIISLFWGTMIAAAVASLWYLPMYLRHGSEFIDQFFIQHHFQRFTSNKYFHPQPFYFFFWVLPLMTIPWLPFFLAAIWDLGKKIFYRRDAETPREIDKSDSDKSITSSSPRLRVSASPLLLFTLAWLIVPLVFFSFSGSKLPGYILPALPAVIILTADYVCRFAKKSRMHKASIQLTAAATFFTVIGLLLLVVPGFAEADSVKGLIAAADERGFKTERVLSLQTVSHNAEFYAAGRLLRTEDGKQKKLNSPAELAEELRREEGKPVLVIVPLVDLKRLSDSGLVNMEVIKENGELAIVYTAAK